MNQLERRNKNLKVMFKKFIKQQMLQNPLSKHKQIVDEGNSVDLIKLTKYILKFLNNIDDSLIELSEECNNENLNLKKGSIRMDKSKIEQLIKLLEGVKYYEWNRIVQVVNQKYNSESQKTTINKTIENSESLEKSLLLEFDLNSKALN